MSAGFDSAIGDPEVRGMMFHRFIYVLLFDPGTNKSWLSFSGSHVCLS